MAEKVLSVFIDESGDFGAYEHHAPYYLVAMVLHDQDVNIAADIQGMNERMRNLGYDHHAIHTGPLIRRESVYANDTMEARKHLFNILYYLSRKDGENMRRNCKMNYDCNIYYGSIVKGDLRSAIAYIKQFPEKRDLYNRFVSVFKHEQYISYDVDSALNEILLSYQQYYRDTFYLCIAKEQAENKLKERLAKLLGIVDEHIALCELEQKNIVNLFESRGLHFLGGKTGGYYGPYIWRTTETVSYDVELPMGGQNYSVKLLDGFIARSWIDYLSFGEIGSGGWADGDGYINCVKSAWDFESESFRVSLLKHEAQHAQDLKMDKNMSSEDLEYRAKLVELIYSTERNLLCSFAQEADNSDKNNGHVMAAYRIVKGFSELLKVDDIQLATISIEQIQTIARTLFENSLK